MPELLGVPADRVDDNRLYRALDALLPHKEALEVHLKNRLGELFDLQYDLLLYDVTSTFFEGQCASNPLAQHGYVLWKTLGQLCAQADLGSEPRRVLSELSEIRLVDVMLPTRDGIEIRRCLTRPSDHQQILLEHLKLNLPTKIKQTEM